MLTFITSIRSIFVHYNFSAKLYCFFTICFWFISKFIKSQVEWNRHHRTHKLQTQEVVKSSIFKNSRSIFLRHTLKKGRYIMLPCTFEAGIQQDFLVRVFTSEENKAKWVQKKLLLNPRAILHRRTLSDLCVYKLRSARPCTSVRAQNYLCYHCATVVGMDEGRVVLFLSTTCVVRGNVVFSRVSHSVQIRGQVVPLPRPWTIQSPSSAWPTWPFPHPKLRTTWPDPPPPPRTMSYLTRSHSPGPWAPYPPSHSLIFWPAHSLGHSLTVLDLPLWLS